MTQRLDNLFRLRYGHSLELNALKQVEAPDGVNFVSRAMGNNGVTARVETSAIPAKAGEMSVALGGNGVLSTFVQPEPFVCGRDVMILTAKNPRMTTTEKLWWARCIWENRYRFSYGRQANRTLAALMVPAGVPEFVSRLKVPTMEGLSRAAGPRLPFKDPIQWSEHRLGDYFSLTRGKYIPQAEQMPGVTPVATSSARNNGISKWLDVGTLFEGGQITVARNGSVCQAFYQPVAFFASDDVFVLDPLIPLSPFSALFVASTIRREKHRYNYGRKLRLPLLEETDIRLPTVTATGKPDWGYMESFMKGLPFSGAVDDVGDVVSDADVVSEHT